MADSCEILAAIRMELQKKEGIPPDRIRLESSLFDFGLSSVKLVELLMVLEEKFDVELPEEEMVGIEMVEELVAAVNARMKS